MNRLLPTTGVSLVLFILGGLLSFTEPASFLDQIQNRIMFALMPAQRETAVCKITIPENATADEVAGLILRLKSRGTKGVILMGKIDGAADSDLFASAIADTNVVWIFDPQMLDSKLRDKAN